MGDGETDFIVYRIDPRQGRFVVQAFAEGLFSSFGHNPTIAIPDFSGEIRLKPGQLETASLKLIVKADSLRVADQVSDKDRREIERMMRDEVLETSRYPEIIFQSSVVSAEKVFEGMYRVKIKGEMTLHQVTRGHLIEGQVTLSNEVLRAQGETRLRQSEYGIKKVSVAGGTLKVKDEVKLSFDIVARKISLEV
jgi:polyisoprenoid-binding protein YceI